MTDTGFKRPHPWFMDSFGPYMNISTDFRESLWLYMAYGIEPGGFGMAVLHNNFYEAVNRAHRMLSADTFRDLSNWLSNCAPQGSFGDITTVSQWINRTDDQRRDEMIKTHLRPSVVDVLKGAPA